MYIASGNEGYRQQLVQQTVKKPPLTFANNNQLYITTNVNGPNGVEELFVNEEEEDEETVKSLARKCKSLDAENLILSWLSHTSNRHFSCNSTKPYYSLLSNKYISQRVLRI